MPNMMENIVMRKCSVRYKSAKQIVAQARTSLGLSERDDGTLLWSKDLEAQCLRIYRHRCGADDDDDDANDGNGGGGGGGGSGNQLVRDVRKEAGAVPAGPPSHPLTISALMERSRSTSRGQQGSAANRTSSSTSSTSSSAKKELRRILQQHQQQQEQNSSVASGESNTGGTHSVTSHSSECGPGSPVLLRAPGTHCSSSPPPPQQQQQQQQQQKEQQQHHRNHHNNGTHQHHHHYRGSTTALATAAASPSPAHSVAASGNASPSRRPSPHRPGDGGAGRRQSSMKATTDNNNNNSNISNMNGGSAGPQGEHRMRSLSAAAAAARTHRLQCDSGTLSKHGDKHDNNDIVDGTVRSKSRNVSTSDATSRGNEDLDRGMGSAPTVASRQGAKVTNTAPRQSSIGARGLDATSVHTTRSRSRTKRPLPDASLLNSKRETGATANGAAPPDSAGGTKQYRPHPTGRPESTPRTHDEGGCSENAGKCRRNADSSSSCSSSCSSSSCCSSTRSAIVERQTTKRCPPNGTYQITGRRGATNGGTAVATTKLNIADVNLDRKIAGAQQKQQQQQASGRAQSKIRRSSKTKIVGLSGKTESGLGVYSAHSRGSKEPAGPMMDSERCTVAPRTSNDGDCTAARASKMDADNGFSRHDGPQQQQLQATAGRTHIKVRRSSQTKIDGLSVNEKSGLTVSASSAHSKRSHRQRSDEPSASVSDSDHGNPTARRSNDEGEYSLASNTIADDRMACSGGSYHQRQHPTGSKVRRSSMTEIGGLPNKRGGLDVRSAHSTRRASDDGEFSQASNAMADDRIPRCGGSSHQRQHPTDFKARRSSMTEIVGLPKKTDGLDVRSAHSTRSHSRRSREFTPAVALLDSNRDIPTERRTGNGDDFADTRASKVVAGTNCRVEENDGDLDRGGTEHTSSSRTRSKSRRSFKAHETGLGGDSSHSGHPQRARSSTSVRLDGPSTHSAQTRSSSSDRATLPTKSKAKTLSKTKKDDDEDGLDREANNMTSTFMPRSASKTKEETEGVERRHTRKSKPAERRLSVPLASACDSPPPGHSKTRPCPSSDAPQTPPRSQTVTRRLVSAEELETACQADPCLREAIAEKAGKSGRLGTFRSSSKGTIKHDGDDHPMNVPKSPFRKGDGPAVIPQRPKSPTTNGLRAFEFENFQTQIAAPKMGSKVLGTHLNARAGMNACASDEKSRNSLGSLGSRSSGSGGVSKTRMVPVVRQRKVSTPCRGGSPTRSITSTWVCSPSRLRPVPTSPSQQMHSPAGDGSVKSPNGILRSSKAQHPKKSIPAPLLIDFGGGDYSPAKSDFGGASALEGSTGKSGWSEGPFSVQPEQQSSKGGNTYQCGLKTPMKSRGTVKTFGTSFVNHGSFDSDDDNTRNLFGPRQMFDSADEVFPEFSRAVSPCRSVRDLNNEFGKQESTRSATAPKPPARKPSMDGQPMRRTMRSGSSDSLSTGSSSSGSRSPRKSVKARRPVKIKVEKLPRIVGPREW